MILVKEKGNLRTQGYGYFIFCVPRHKEIHLQHTYRHMEAKLYFFYWFVGEVCLPDPTQLAIQRGESITSVDNFLFAERNNMMNTHLCRFFFLQQKKDAMSKGLF